MITWIYTIFLYTFFLLIIILICLFCFLFQSTSLVPFFFCQIFVHKFNLQVLLIIEDEAHENWRSWSKEKHVCMCWIYSLWTNISFICSVMQFKLKIQIPSSLAYRYTILEAKNRKYTHICMYIWSEIKLHRYNFDNYYTIFITWYKI